MKPSDAPRMRAGDPLPPYAATGRSSMWRRPKFAYVDPSVARANLQMPEVVTGRWRVTCASAGRRADAGHAHPCFVRASPKRRPSDEIVRASSTANPSGRSPAQEEAAVQDDDRTVASCAAHGALPKARSAIERSGGALPRRGSVPCGARTCSVVVSSGDQETAVQVTHRYCESGGPTELGWTTTVSFVRLVRVARATVRGRVRTPSRFGGCGAAGGGGTLFCTTHWKYDLLDTSFSVPKRRVHRPAPSSQSSLAAGCRQLGRAYVGERRGSAALRCWRRTADRRAASDVAAYYQLVTCCGRPGRPRRSGHACSIAHRPRRR
ncbi:MAG: hypothetical protein ACLT98_10870 [Eggerthellaceae bacterium]